MPLKARDYDKVTNKFDFRTKTGSHHFAWLEVDGKVVVRTKRSHKSSGDLPMWYSIRQQLHLNETQLRQAISCTLTKSGYLNILREKGIID